MTAGRELDELIAEKVFGETGPHRIMPEYDLPPFSTDITAAWEVVEKLERDGWGHKHLVHSPGTENPGVEWQFHSPGLGANSLSTVKAETVALAICLAALKAVGCVGPLPAA